MSRFVAAYTRKNHFLAGEIDMQIEALRTNGVLNQLINKYTNNKLSHQASIKSNPSQLKMENLRGAFEILIFGLMIAFIVFVFEIFSRVIKRFVKLLAASVNRVIGI